ncbi:hypothetical protein [Pseudomonas putida]|uniref:hypothetical protein n=1 Tax=Pseudomonas putida TaxID=303 RepID=UPI003CC7C532
MGALDGLFGIGGGLVAIPFMILFLDLSQTVAQGTALVMMVPNVAIALWGVNCAYRMPEHHLRRLFAGFLVASATMLLIKG